MTETFTPVPMDPMVRDLWTTALRSGEYAQTTGTLRDSDGYCCLGVLCDLAPATLGEFDDVDRFVSAETEEVRDWTGTVVRTFPKFTSVSLPPNEVKGWSGVDFDTVSFGEIPTSYETDEGEAIQDSERGLFASLNDTAHATFEQIADLIDGLPVVIGDTTYQYDAEASAERAADKIILTTEDEAA